MHVCSAGGAAAVPKFSEQLAVALGAAGVEVEGKDEATSDEAKPASSATQDDDYDDSSPGESDECEVSSVYPAHHC